MTENPPISKSVKDFNFKLKCRLKLFERLQVERPTSLLAVASKYGLIFAGTPTGVQCIRTESLLSLEVDLRHIKNVSAYPRRNLQLGVQPSHIAVNADGELLAVAFVSGDCAVMFVYSIASFGSTDLIKKNEIRLSSTPGVTVTDMQWSTGLPDVFAIVMSDGSAASFSFQGSSFKLLGSIPQNSHASCLCWSPKGKQVVIGAKNGSLTQYKPELKAVKTFAPPQVQGSAGLAVVSVHWLSSFQFIAVYNSSDPSARASVMVVNVPKNAQPSFVNYEDFCFGSNTSRPEHYFIRQQAWNILIVGTTNSIEANVLGMDGNNWVPWMLDDGGRAELPLTDDHQDVLNIGMGFDTSPSQPILIGENQTIDPMPLLLMLSHEGVLCCFQAINTMQGAPKICQPPQPFPDPSGLHMFNLPEAGDTSLSGPSGVEPQKTPDFKGVGEQMKQSPQPNATKWDTLMGQASAAQPSSPFSMNLSFGQLSSGQPISFAQPILGQTTMNQAHTSPLSKFSLPNQAQTSSPATSGQIGQTLGGFGLTRPPNQMTFSTAPVPNASAPTGLPQTSWPTVMNQNSPLQKPIFAQPADSSPKASTVNPPLSQNTAQPQSKLLQALTQSNQTSRQPATAPSVTQPVQSIQPHAAPLSSLGNAPLLNQQQSFVNSNLPTMNQFQPDQVNKSPQTQSQSPQTQSQSSPTTQSLPPEPVSVQPANTPQQRTKLATVAEVEEKPEENETIKAEKIIALCQEFLRTFSADMEQKQRAIKYTISQTEHNIGESKCKDQLIQDIENLKRFEDELKETKAPDEADVNAIGSSVLEIFGWYEKIKAKERMTKNPGYIELMESHELDPVTKNYLNNIDRYVYYLESQIKLAKAKSGALWDNIGSPNFEVPVMEVIYQSLVAQMNVLAAKKAVVDSCEAKMKKINKNRRLRNPRKHTGDLELSTLAERLLDTRISDTDLLQNTSLRNASNNYILLSKRMAKKSLNEDKVSALHQWHKNHKLITTKVSKKNAIMTNSDISKDETFCRIISPSKQSTPYCPNTPKKVTSSLPRKSLFTLTNNINCDNDELSQSVNNLDIEKNNNGDENPTASLLNKTEKDAKQKSETPVCSIDNSLKNNLSSIVSKVADINKIEGIQNIDNIMSNKTASSIASTVSNDNIPTPAAFKAVQPPKGKSENIISTSWGTQTPAFSKIFFSSPTMGLTGTKNSAPISSASIYPGSSSASKQVTSPSVSASSFSFNLSGNVGDQISTPPSINQKSTSQLPTVSSANLQFCPTTPKSTVTSPLTSSETDNYEPTATDVSAMYTPTPIKPSSNATFSFTPTAASLPSTVSTASYTNISPVSHSTAPNTFNLNPILPAPNSNQFSFGNKVSTTTVPLFGGLSSVSSSVTITKAVSTPSSTATSSDQSNMTISLVTSPNQRIFAASPDINNVAAPPTTVSETETSPKPSALTWTQGNIFGGNASSPISGPTPATSSTTTVASIFGSSSILGSFTSPVASNQSIFGGSPGISSVSSAPSSVASSVSSATAVTSTPLFGPTSTTAATTSAHPAPSSTAASTHPPATSPSVPNFGTGTVTSSPSVAQFVAVATTANALSLLNSSATTSSTVFASPVVTSSTPLFSGQSVTVAAASTFQSAATTASVFSTTATTTTASIFGGTTTATSIFGSTPKTSASIFGTPTTSASFFGSNSVFGGTTSSVFGAANTKTTSTVFGATNTTTTPSVFGISNVATTPSVFGTASTTTPSVFGATNTTTTPSVFGTTNSTTTPSVFGATNTTTSPSVFGSVNTTTTSIFGASNTTTSSSVFGAASTTTASTGFGSPANQGSSIFGATAAAALSSTSFFGSPATTSSASFGNQQAASIFGGTSNFSTPSTTNSFFLKGISSPASTTANVFGSSTNVFGATTTASGTSIFGGNSFQQKSVFGQNSGNVFGQTTNSGAGAGNFGSSGGSLFGGTSSFGAPSPQGNIFQSGGTGNLFGAAANASPFSGGSQPAGQSVFGSPPSFQAAQTPVFGGQSTFGAPPTFGAAPAFGGSPSKVFGSTSPGSAPAFGSQSSTFENLASQDTLSFGNLAQQQTFPTSSFGGSSFSSWRS